MPLWGVLFLPWPGVPWCRGELSCSPLEHSSLDRAFVFFLSSPPPLFFFQVKKPRASGDRYGKGHMGQEEGNLRASEATNWQLRSGHSFKQQTSRERSRGPGLCSNSHWTSGTFCETEASCRGPTALTPGLLEHSRGSHPRGSCLEGGSGRDPHICGPSTGKKSGS